MSAHGQHILYTCHCHPYNITIIQTIVKLLNDSAVRGLILKTSCNDSIFNYSLI